MLIDTGNYPTLVDGVQRRICSNTITTDCVDLSGLIPDYVAAIPSSTNYTVARGNDGRVYVNTTETAANLSCPTGYIRVPGNSLYQTKDFCVMKYEAKAVEISNPTVGLIEPSTGFNTIANNTTATTSANGRAIASVASGYPIANINQTTAASYCTTAGASLITNAEWMTIARNIEAQSSNWTGGSVGSGGLWRGHSDNIPYSALVASTDDNLGYEGTGNNINNGWQEKRTHTLSNGEIIWDFSANMWEWTNDTILQRDQPYSVTGSSWTLREHNSIINNGTLRYDDYGPGNKSWSNSQNNIGAMLSHGPNTNNSVRVFRRGGGWLDGQGLFSLFLDFTPSNTGYGYTGFRCVLR